MKCLLFFFCLALLDATMAAPGDLIQQEDVLDPSSEYKTGEPCVPNHPNFRIKYSYTVCSCSEENKLSCSEKPHEDPANISVYVDRERTFVTGSECVDVLKDFKLDNENTICHCLDGKLFCHPGQ